MSVKRSDGRKEKEIELKGLNKIELKLGASNGILCGAALPYAGKKMQKSVNFMDKTYKDTAISHSGDRMIKGRSEHKIDIDLKKMPMTDNKIYLTLCSCGAE